MIQQDKSVQLKLSLLKLVEEIGSVSKACAMMNFSRDSYYRFLKRFEEGGEEGLKNINRKKPLLKNRVSRNVEKAVCDLALEHPCYGQQKASVILAAKNIMVSPSGVRSIWIRHDLETGAKRAQAIRAKIRQDGLVPNSEQLKVASARHGARKTTAIEGGGPGYLGFHTLQAVGNVGGLGPIFLHCFLDAYSRHAFILLDTAKDDVTATGFLENRVLPWYAGRNTSIQTIRSDRAMTFCGRGKPNQYQKLLAGLNIEHAFRSSRGSATDLSTRDFNQALQDEFLRFALRSRASWTLEALQQAADEWLAFYNEARPNPLRFCYGKTPLATFIDAVTGEAEKNKAKLPPAVRLRGSSG
jgi:hypothetical protein